MPLARYCELLQAEQRSKALTIRLAVSIEERMRLEAANDSLCAALFERNHEQQCAPGLPDVARLELAPPVKKGFDA